MRYDVNEIEKYLPKDYWTIGGFKTEQQAYDEYLKRTDITQNVTTQEYKFFIYGELVYKAFENMLYRKCRENGVEWSYSSMDNVVYAIGKCIEAHNKSISYQSAKGLIKEIKKEAEDAIKYEVGSKVQLTDEKSLIIISVPLNIGTLSDLIEFVIEWENENELGYDSNNIEEYLPYSCRSVVDFIRTEEYESYLQKHKDVGDITMQEYKFIKCLDFIESEFKSNINKQSMDGGYSDGSGLYIEDVIESALEYIKITTNDIRGYDGVQKYVEGIKDYVINAIKEEYQFEFVVEDDYTFIVVVANALCENDFHKFIKFNVKNNKPTEHKNALDYLNHISTCAK